MRLAIADSSPNQIDSMTFRAASISADPEGDSNRLSYSITLNFPSR